MLTQDTDDSQIATENEILRARQLRILRKAGARRVDERISHLLATGEIAASQVLRGYERLMCDAQAPHPRRK
jgi:hypothetical protein